MAQSFNFSFSNDDIEDDDNGEEFVLPQSGGLDCGVSSPQLIEPRLHSLQELVSRICFVSILGCFRFLLLCFYEFWVSGEIGWIYVLFLKESSWALNCHPIHY